MHKYSFFRKTVLVWLILLGAVQGVPAQNAGNLKNLDRVDNETRASIMMTLQGQEKALQNGVWIYTVQNVTPTSLPDFDNALFLKGIGELKATPGFKLPDGMKSPAFSAADLVVLEKSDNELVLLSPVQCYAVDENGRESHEFVRLHVANHGRILYQELVKRVYIPGQGGSEVVTTELMGAQATTKKKVGPTSYDWGTPEGQLTAWQFGMGFDAIVMSPNPISKGLVKWDTLKYAPGKTPETLALYLENYLQNSDGNTSLGYMEFKKEGTKKEPVLRPVELALSMAVANGDKHVVVESWVYDDPKDPIVPKRAVMYKQFSKENASARSTAIAYDVYSFKENSTLDENMFSTNVAAGTPVYDENVGDDLVIGDISPIMSLDYFGYEDGFWRKEDSGGNHVDNKDETIGGNRRLSIHSRSSITQQDKDVTYLRLFYSYHSEYSYINDYYYNSGYPWGVSLDRDVHWLWDECADGIDQNYLGDFAPDRWNMPAHDDFADGEATDGSWSMTYVNYTTPSAGDYATTMTFVDNCTPSDLGSVHGTYKCSQDPHSFNLVTTATLIDCYISPSTITLRAGESKTVTAYSIPNDVKGTWHWNTTTPEYVVFVVNGQEVTDVYHNTSETVSSSVTIKGKSAGGPAEICVEFMSEPDDWGHILDPTFPHDVPNDRRGFGEDQKYFTVSQ